jgi:integrase
LTNVKVKRKDVIGDKEILDELANANLIKDESKRLRARAVISLLESGKRANELAALEVSDITEDQRFLYVRFTLSKKRKTKSQKEKSIQSLQRTKTYNISSDMAQIIREYLSYLLQKYPGVKHLFPRLNYVFGNLVSIDLNQHMNRLEIWRTVKALNPLDWPHQHRERRAKKVVEAHQKMFGKATLETIYSVRKALDLKEAATAYRYIDRYEVQKVEEEDLVIS